MARICPICGGNQTGCPTCNAPPMRVIPKTAMMLTGGMPLRSRLSHIMYGAKMWEVQGIDISRHNGNMNFAITKTKCQYGIMRLGYGNEWKDPKSDVNYQGAMSNDFPMGAYWFCYIGQNAQMHAINFASEIATHRPQLNIVLDAETTTLDPTGTLNWLIACDKELTRLTGKQAIIYTAAWFWNTKVARSSYFSNRMNWVANWTTRDYPYTPTDLSLWGDWQWSADGNKKALEYGSTGGDPDMDLDRSILTVAQFNAKFGTHISPIGVIPPPQPPPGTVPEVVVIGAVDVNIRSEPNPIGDTNVIGLAPSGKKWFPESIVKDQFGSEWYKMGKKVYIKKELTRLP